MLIIVVKVNMVNHMLRVDCLLLFWFKLNELHVN
jgi:hypothetical protein